MQIVSFHSTSLHSYTPARRLIKSLNYSHSSWLLGSLVRRSLGTSSGTERCGVGPLSAHMAAHTCISNRHTIPSIISSVSKVFPATAMALRDLEVALVDFKGERNPDYDHTMQSRCERLVHVNFPPLCVAGFSPDLSTAPFLFIIALLNRHPGPPNFFLFIFYGTLWNTTRTFNTSLCRTMAGVRYRTTIEQRKAQHHVFSLPIPPPAKLVFKIRKPAPRVAVSGFHVM